MEYIFLAGIHGVGKSTLAKRLESKIEIKAFSVSDLIRKAGKGFTASTKNTQGISQNQHLWKRELKKLEIHDSFLLLDGHFCLLDVEKNITPLPFSTFEGTQMSKIVLMENSPKIIRDRLFNRDNVDYSIGLLQKMQEFERFQAIKYSSENSIRMFIYDEKEPFQELVDFITN